MNKAVLSDAELDFLGRYFGMGKGSEIISHPPHATISRQQEAFDGLKAHGLLIETPFNQYGIKRITCTEEASRLGAERMKVRMRAYFDESSPPKETQARTGMES